MMLMLYQTQTLTLLTLLTLIIIQLEQIIGPAVCTLKDCRSRSLGCGNVKIVFGAYLRAKCIDSRKTKTMMHSCQWNVIRLKAKIH